VTRRETALRKLHAQSKPDRIVVVLAEQRALETIHQRELLLRR
jgi:hypothetical protein